MSIQSGELRGGAAARVESRRQRAEQQRAESRRVGWRRGALAGFLAGTLFASAAAAVYETNKTLNPGCAVVVRPGQTLDGIAAKIAGRIGQGMEEVSAAIESTPGPVNSGDFTLQPGDELNLPAGPDCQAVVEDPVDFPRQDVLPPMYPPYPLDQLNTGNIGAHQG